MSSADEKKVLLKSSDGETFQVEEAVALQFEIIREMIEDKGPGNEPLPLENVKGSILSKVIDYCKKHVEAREDEDDLKSWDNDFVKVDHGTLLDLILAANYLNIKSLLDLTCQAVADMIRGKTHGEICKIFNISNSFTPEEEEEVRRENRWAFE